MRILVPFAVTLTGPGRAQRTPQSNTLYDHQVEKSAA